MNFADQAQNAALDLTKAGRRGATMIVEVPDLQMVQDRIRLGRRRTLPAPPAWSSMQWSSTPTATANWIVKN